MMFFTKIFQRLTHCAVTKTASVKSKMFGKFTTIKSEILVICARTSTATVLLRSRKKIVGIFFYDVSSGKCQKIIQCNKSLFLCNVHTYTSRLRMRVNDDDN